MSYETRELLLDYVTVIGVCVVAGSILVACSIGAVAILAWGKARGW